MHSRFEPETTQQLIPAPAAIETYLDALCAPLIATTEAEEVTAIRSEMRAHLLSLAAAYEELGSTKQEAMREALQKFGSARQVGTSLRSEHMSALCSPEFIATIGLPLTSVIGGLAAYTAMMELEQVYLATRIFQAAVSPFSSVYVVVLSLGLVAGAVVWLRRAAPLRSAVWAGAIPAVILSSLCAHKELSNWSVIPGSVHFTNMLSIVPGMALFAATASVSVGVSGVIGKLLRRLGHRPRAATRQKQ